MGLSLGFQENSLFSLSQKSIAWLSCVKSVMSVIMREDYSVSVVIMRGGCWQVGGSGAVRRMEACMVESRVGTQRCWSDACVLLLHT